MRQGELEALRLVVQQLQDQVRELKARLDLSSRNSSKPPSTDPPQTKRPPRTKGTGRKKGGQPGHKGKTRDWFPPEDVDRFVQVQPPECDHCGQRLSPEECSVVGSRRQQVVEIPAASAEVTEYILHDLGCAVCGEKTAAVLPEGVMPWAVGPRLQAVMATLSGRFRLSRREVLEAVVALFGPKARVSLGTLLALENRTRLALTPAYEEAGQAVLEAEIVHPDETSYYEGTHKSWLWVAATLQVAYFRIDAQRGLGAFGRLLPDFVGSIVVDRWSAYGRHPPEKRQLCWAHLKRNFQELVDRGYPATLVGRPGLRAADAVFEAWRRHREGKLTRPGLARRLAPAKRKLERALRRGLKNGDQKARAMSKDVLPQFACLWTFTKIDGMAPENNHAERMIRPAVLWRKGSFGTQSRRGSRFAECMLTVSQTLKLQGRSVLDFIEASIRAARSGTAAPSLVTP